MRIFSIILADDEQQILYGMKKGIEWEKLGFRVAGVAQNGKEALELMEEVHPDLVISDIKMPFMDGLELAKHIHEDYMNTKVILFSGWDDFEYARLAISYGVSEYIMKPINYEEMQNLLMKMHEELDKEYNEKMNRARLEHAYMESLPLLRQQFFTRLVTEKMNKNELQSQIDNLKLEFTDAVYSVVAMKVGRGDEKDVLSELAVKQTIKEALEKITRVYEFGMSDNEIFILGSNKKHDVGRITRTIDEAVVLIERIFQSRISCGISVSREKIEDMPSLQEFGKGNYDIKAKEEGIGELKNLSAHFNIMADKLQEQMEEIRRNERERQQMEKKLLQSQINPHFLYNTLDSIIWMIRSEEYEGAGKMVSLLAKFFRISLSQGKDMIPLEKELEHASSYLAIQNIRFKDKFEFQIEADPALLKYLCPKLSIQPLLENAIYHGMEGMYEDGEITIRIYDRDGDIGIDVADNGPGMTQETIDHIMHNKVISSKRGSGIGVRNVNERIQLIYGEDYGVIITSELDEGTTATITIPKMEETDDAR